MDVIGIGTEIIECVRIARMIEQHGELFLERVYTAEEVAYCSERSSATQHFAARWAAKEAVLKAILGRSRGIRWNEIEVISTTAYGPSIQLSGRAAEWAAHRGIARFQISLGRCRTHATAFVIAIGND
ncbi:MAG: holo-ACP synthase [Planctomycetaceae bacterium]